MKVTCIYKYCDEYLKKIPDTLSQLSSFAYLSHLLSILLSQSKNNLPNEYVFMFRFLCSSPTGDLFKHHRLLHFYLHILIFKIFVGSLSDDANGKISLYDSRFSLIYFAHSIFIYSFIYLFIIFVYFY